MPSALISQQHKFPSKKVVTPAAATPTKSATQIRQPYLVQALSILP